jgi:hypothetical protein
MTPEQRKQAVQDALIKWLEYEYDRIKEMKYFSDQFKQGYAGAIHDLKVVIKEGLPSPPSIEKH